MNKELQAQYIAVLVDLHRGLARQGPGDRQFTQDLLRKLPPLPTKPRIADLGCGTGAGALLLAQHYQSNVKAVDVSPVFIDELKDNAIQAGLDQFVAPICADMAALDWPHASLDLLWSEGAAYNLGFEHALKVWRPLLAEGGVAVISEMSWFADAVPERARNFWQSEYPAMSTEKQNIAHARDAGFCEVFTKRLPASAWWENYYGPLRERVSEVDATDMMRKVIHETEQEMLLFEKFSNYYGYTFYVLTIPGPHSA